MKLKYGWVYRQVYKTIMKYINTTADVIIYWIAFKFDKLVGILKGIFK